MRRWWDFEWCMWGGVGKRTEYFFCGRGMRKMRGRDDGGNWKGGFYYGGRMGFV